MGNASVSRSDVSLQRSDREPPAPVQWPQQGPDALFGVIVQCAAKQAVHIVRSLGLSQRVDLETFAHIVGLSAGGSTGLAQGLTGHELCPSDEAIRDAEATYLAAYRSMRSGG